MSFKNWFLFIPVFLSCVFGWLNCFCRLCCNHFLPLSFDDVSITMLESSRNSAYDLTNYSHDFDWLSPRVSLILHDHRRLSVSLSHTLHFDDHKGEYIYCLFILLRCLYYVLDKEMLKSACVSTWFLLSCEDSLSDASSHLSSRFKDSHLIYTFFVAW